MSSLTASEKATYSWIPSYAILLNGDEKTLATQQFIFAMLRLQFFPRASLATTNTSVCPLKKPQDSSVPWDPQHFWLWGLEPFWEKELTQRQQEITELASKSQLSPDNIKSTLPLSTLDCSHKCSTIDWANNVDMMILSVLFVADQEFIYQLCLVDPDLMQPVHLSDSMDHPHPA